MKCVFVFILLIGLVARSLTQLQVCPRRATIPPRPPPQTAGEVRQERRLENALLDDWFADRRRGTREAVSWVDQSAQQVTSGKAERVKRSAGIMRKEYRQMTATEMQTWHTCLQRMKNQGIFDEMTNMHNINSAPGAHGGVAFLPWHRVYLWEFERRMRQINGCSNTFVPYWDSALESHLPVHSDAVLWADEFWGTNDGTVTTGLAANWQMTSDCTERGDILRRIITGSADNLYTNQEILDLFTGNTFAEFVIARLAGTRVIEAPHNGHHCYFRCGSGGSHIGQLKCAPSDPAFWMLHSMVDAIWDEWQKLPNTGNDYPRPGTDGVLRSDMGRNPAAHMPWARMRPFVNPNNNRPLRNRHGMRSRYRCPYNVRPSKERCIVDGDCDSPQGMLFCDSCGRCTSKVRVRGRCDQLPNRACYCSTGTSRCRNNRCQCN